jgi:lon-related putative ATP-dependent protease
MNHHRLEPSLLFKPCPPQELPFETTAELEPTEVVIGQKRALGAVQFGIRIDGDGYNVFALGPSGIGKLTAIRQVIAQEAKNQPLPSDWCYVNNFTDPGKPKALRLAPGRGNHFRKNMEQFVEELSTAIPAAFEGDEYRSRAEEFAEEAKEREVEALNELRKEAADQRIILIETPTGYAFAPMNENNEVLDPEQFKKLSEQEQNRIQETVVNLQQKLQKLLRKFPGWRKETKEKIKQLNREIARLAVNHLIEALRTEYADSEAILDYLDRVEQDISDHVDLFRPAQEAPMPPFGVAPHPPFKRYQVNLIVDHSGQETIPVVYEDHPSHGNLIGRVEYQAQMGTLVTDFTMIRPGALHRANGGYLILDVRKVLLQPYAWDSLKRTMQSGEIRIESLEKSLSLISTTSLEPEPIPLDLKILLVGDRLLYYMLSLYDPEFCDLFKVSADFEESMDRDAKAHLLYARMIGSLAQRQKLLPLERGAVARVIEHSARLVGDSEKLSTHLRSITDLLQEADYWAQQASHSIIEAADVQQAINHQIKRADRIRDRVYEQIRRGTIMIDTQGEVVGQINGLSVIQLGGFSFGQPSRITATTRLGEGGVVDIERETELGGAIHSKGVFILSGFLSARYAREKPLSVAISLVFEQSYGMVDGDSASLAELCTILSSLSAVPIRQSLAITGSVNQLGQAQPIGGVNEKIEGFFDVCNQSGLTGEQGVIIPETNVKHLMLRHDVVDAVRLDRFHIFAVATVDQALELLTNVTAGERDAQGRFVDDSVNARVEQQLLQYADIRHNLAEKENKHD